MRIWSGSAVAMVQPGPNEYAAVVGVETVDASATPNPLSPDVGSMPLSWMRTVSVPGAAVTLKKTTMARNPVQSMMPDRVVAFRVAKASAVPVTRWD